MAYKTTADLLIHQAHALGSLPDATFLLRRRKARVEYTIADDTGDDYPILIAEAPCIIKSVKFLSTTTQAAGANSYSLQVRKNDGAGGALSAVSMLYDGTTTAITANSVASFAGIDDTDTLAAGEALYVTSTENGAASAIGEILFEVDYELT